MSGLPALPSVSASLHPVHMLGRKSSNQLPAQARRHRMKLVASGFPRQDVLQFGFRFGIPCCPCCVSLLRAFRASARAIRRFWAVSGFCLFVLSYFRIFVFSTSATADAMIPSDFPIF